MKKYVPLFVAIMNLLLCLAYLGEARQYRVYVSGIPGPGLFPWTIGLFWLAMSLWTIVEVWRGGMDAGLAVEWTDMAGWIRIAIVLACAAGFILTLDLLGDLVAGFLVMAIVMRTMGMKSIVRLVATSAGLMLLFHFVFVSQLGVILPQGIWSDLGWM